MHRRPSILVPVLTLAVLAGAPTAALAQTFPASAAVAAGVQALGPDTRAFTLVDRNPATQWRAPALETTPAPTAHIRPLKLQPRLALETADAPRVEIRAKDAWSDDQGLRVHKTMATFKQRF